MVLTQIVSENLTVAYGDNLILDNINLKFDKPELVCILGPNGVGKTTFAKCIVKLLKPVSGEILIDGRPVKDIGLVELARKIAYVPNSSQSAFGMSVVESVLMGRHPRSGWMTSAEDLEAVDEAIEILGLRDFADRDVRELSAGQSQRVMIARGLVQEPEVLILDEPTSNLDVKYQMDVMKFLKNYAKTRNILVIMVCHDLNITAAYADRVILMHDRKVFADGKADEVLTEDSIRQVYQVNAKIFNVNGMHHIALLPEDRIWTAT